MRVELRGGSLDRSFVHVRSPWRTTIYEPTELGLEVYRYDWETDTYKHTGEAS